MLLGNVAYRSGGKLTYDGRTGRVTGNANAERYLRREYRKGVKRVKRTLNGKRRPIRN